MMRGLTQNLSRKWRAKRCFQQSADRKRSSVADDTHIGLGNVEGGLGVQGFLKMGMTGSTS
jgi:hypothetical protein